MNDRIGTVARLGLFDEPAGLFWGRLNAPLPHSAVVASGGSPAFSTLSPELQKRPKCDSSDDTGKQYVFRPAVQRAGFSSVLAEFGLGLRADKTPQNGRAEFEPTAGRNHALGKAGRGGVG
jgi:hypothetical protein